MVLDDVDAQPAKAIAAAAVEKIKALEMRIRDRASGLLSHKGYTRRSIIGVNELSRFFQGARAGLEWAYRPPVAPTTLPRQCRRTARIPPAAPHSVATCLVQEPP